MHDSEELQETEQILLDAPESTELIECAGDDDRDTDNAWVQYGSAYLIFFNLL